MTIQEVIDKLQYEKQNRIESRFPCRAIMVKNIPQYCELLGELKKIDGIRMIESTEVFTSVDVLPRYEQLITDPVYQNEWVILTGVSEYLRLFAKSERESGRFSSLWRCQKAASSTGRIIIPLWGCEAQWKDQSLQLETDLRQKEFYFSCYDVDDEEQRMNVLVLSSKFDRLVDDMKNNQSAFWFGLEGCFSYWMNPNPNTSDFTMITDRYRGITPAKGHINISVQNSILSYIQGNMPGAGILTPQNCTPAMQEKLLEKAHQGEPLDTAILSILNLTTFDGVEIWAKWDAMSEEAKRFSEVWLMMHDDGTYLHHCFSKIESIEALPSVLAKEIFAVRSIRPDWVREYQRLAKVGKMPLDEEYFRLLDQVPEFEVRLDFVIGHSQPMRTYLLRMVGQWLQVSASQALASKKLQQVYPELSAYLCSPEEGMPAELQSYFIRYKTHKLANTLPADEELHFAGIQTEDYDYRYSALSDAIDGDTVILWIDALGAEWLPLLAWKLTQIKSARLVSSAVVQATLPTETEYNDQWNQMTVKYEKLDTLDKLAHKGVIDDPDYYSCIADQIGFFAELQKRIEKLLKTYHRVIITGDHGTSRLAARFFHNRDGVVEPAGAKVRSHGRYCILGDSDMPAFPGLRKASLGSECFAVFTTYDHFKQSGFAAGASDDQPVYGEVHGGATPEEMLVPVLVMDTLLEIPMTASWEKDKVKLGKGGRAQVNIKFSKPVSKLEVKIGTTVAQTSKSGDATDWSAVLTGIKPGTYNAMVTADERVVNMLPITIQAALSPGIGDLP